MKTAVAEGAAGLAKFMNLKSNFHSLSIAARFGLLFYKFDGSIDYQELINPQSSLSKISVGNETKIGVEVEEEVSLINVARIAVLQTFEIEETIRKVSGNEQDLYNKATFLDQFTRDESFKTTNQGVVFMQVYDDGEVHVEFNGEEPPKMTSRSFDLDYNEVYLKSMWPYLKPPKNQAA